MPVSSIHLASILSYILAEIMVTCYLLLLIQQLQHPSLQDNRGPVSGSHGCLYTHSATGVMLHAGLMKLAQNDECSLEGIYTEALL